MGERIISKIKMGPSGQEYDIIGLGATEEAVAINLFAPDTITWTDYYVTVQNVTLSTSTTYQLNSNGECFFSIDIGEIYEVTYPTITGYSQPLVQRYTASVPTRSLLFTYTTSPLQTEQIIISLAENPAQSTSIFEGSHVIITINGVSTLYAITDDEVRISVQYGTSYSLSYPTITGWTHDHVGDAFTAGQPSRYIVVTYTYLDEGVYGYDSAGNRYTISQIETGILEGTLSADDIIAGGYNDTYLANAQRKDGTYGCGFMWKITGGTTSGQWCNQNVEFDTTKLPFRQSDSAARTDCDGCGNTGYIQAICAQSSDLRSSMCTNAQAKTLTIGGNTKTGFVLAYGQIVRLLDNRILLEYLYNILGKTCPTIWSGGWWSSCLYSALGGVGLYGGSFYGDHKTYDPSVLVGFDL